MEEVNIAFLGDIMPGGLFHGNNDIVSSEIAKILSFFDIRVATLECAIGDNLEFDSEKMERKDWRNIIYAHNIDLCKLKYLGIDVVSLANNHVFDLGENGLVNTINLLDSLGIKYCGAGLNKELASQPAVIDKGGKTFAFLAYMPFWWEAPHPATEDKPGINLFYMNQVVVDIKEAKRKYDYVFVLPHWGLEYTFIPTNRERVNAKMMLDAGADGIIGSHTHQLQPLVIWNRRPVCFSLGNFAFPDFYIQPTRPIWYPDNTIDVSTIEVSYTYPDYTDKYLKRVWKKCARKGGILALGIKENMVRGKMIYTYLNSENIVVLKSCGLSVKFVLWFVKLCLSFRYYKYLSGLYYRLYFSFQKLRQ